MRVQAPGRVEIDTRPVLRTRRAVADMAVAMRQSLEKTARLRGKRMLATVARAVDPPDLPRRVPCRQCMEHGEHRGCADAGTQQDDGPLAWLQREAAARRAHLQHVANLDPRIDVSPGRAM